MVLPQDENQAEDEAMNALFTRDNVDRTFFIVLVFLLGNVTGTVWGILAMTWAYLEARP